MALGVGVVGAAGVAPAPVVGVVVVAAWWWLGDRADVRTRVLGPPRRRRIQWPSAEVDDGLEVLRELSRSLAVGGELGTALSDAAAIGDGPTARRVGDAVAAVAAGRPMVDELRSLATRDADVVRAGLWTALAAAGPEGGPLRHAVDRAVDTHRERDRLRSEARAQAGQAIASAGVLVVAPVVYLCLFAVVDPATPLTLLTTTVGRVCLVLGLVLDAVGIWWIRRLVRGAVA